MGAKVVCVSQTSSVIRKPLVVGATYTIRNTGVDPISGCVGCWLEEVSNPIRSTSCGLVAELGYMLKRFRPLITQQDDIEIHFKALLDVPEKVGV